MAMMPIETLFPNLGIQWS